MSVSERNSPSPSAVVHGCDRIHRALAECHRRIAAGPSREAACRHLNRALAECLVAVACPEESDAVRTLCSSGGTPIKRRQCELAKLSLSACLSSHQTEL
ncbi:cytochrome C oxidase biogenesis Cmc1-like protein [Perilla frutescens var. hirtella]|uniref:COX assembly mitochondrial protein n=1 Tax=Perilla frutescens var. hirtella TaxID=608512 RepID=A0AAD4IQK6_PERFH|nr:cytochrome C oxidase biogenesis Cmc1-like protein [Perilla frutescens var. hirtella]